MTRDEDEVRYTDEWGLVILAGQAVARGEACGDFPLQVLPRGRSIHQGLVHTVRWPWAGAPVGDGVGVPCEVVVMTILGPVATVIDVTRAAFDELLLEREVEQ